MERLREQNSTDKNKGGNNGEKDRLCLFFNIINNGYGRLPESGKAC